MQISTMITIFFQICAGSDALNDIAINMRNIGVNPKFEQDRVSVQIARLCFRRWI